MVGSWEYFLLQQIHGLLINMTAIYSVDVKHMIGSIILDL